MSKYNCDKDTNLLYVSQQGKRNMWIYYHKKSDALFLIDPIAPTIETINFIDELNIANKHIVLTACQREKKINVKLWRKIFSSIKIITPDQTFFSDETVIPINDITYFDNPDSICFLNTMIGNMHRLCMKSYQYLFMGEIIYSIFKDFNTIDDMRHQNDITSAFYDTLEPNVVTFHSFGAISLLSDIFVYQYVIKDEFIDGWK